MNHQRNDAPSSQRARGLCDGDQARPKRRLSGLERQRRREVARRDREAERRSLAVLHDVQLEPRVDAATVAERRAEMPDEDKRNLTGRVFGDPNPADRRREDN